MQRGGVRVTRHSGIRIATALCVTWIAAAVLASAAWASEYVYWGYNNLTAPNPPAGTCPGATSGIACDGWNYWDYSRVDWNSGRSAFTFGFICSYDGLLWGRVMSGDETFKIYDALWSTYCPTHYNRTAVAHLNGGSESYNYLQSRSLIFP